MPATVIAERIEWTNSIRVLRDQVTELRRCSSSPTGLLSAGRARPFGWQPDVEIPVGFGQSAKLWVVVGVYGFSRYSGGWMVPTRAGVTAVPAA